MKQIEEINRYFQVSEERVMVGSDAGSLFLFENGEVRAEYDVSIPEEDRPISFLT